jgi:hypothetical protein
MIDEIFSKMVDSSCKGAWYIIQFFHSIFFSVLLGALCEKAPIFVSATKHGRRSYDISGGNSYHVVLRDI